MRCMFFDNEQWNKIKRTVSDLNHALRVRETVMKLTKMREVCQIQKKN